MEAIEGAHDVNLTVWRCPSKAAATTEAQQQGRGLIGRVVLEDGQSGSPNRSLIQRYALRCRMPIRECQKLHLTHRGCVCICDKQLVVKDNGCGPFGGFVAEDDKPLRAVVLISLKRVHGHQIDL